MSGVNKVILIGNCGSDPEVKELGEGRLVANVSLATSESYKDKNTGERIEKSEWHRLSFFGPLAGVVEKYVKKGDKLYVEGKLETRSWEKDGVKQFSTGIVCNQMQMLGSPQGGDQGTRPAARDQGSQPAQRERQGQGDPQQARSRQRQSAPVDSFQDDYIPF